MGIGLVALVVLIGTTGGPGSAIPVGTALLLMLLFINKYIGNFGWSIVILTIVINMVLFPLRVKQQLAMQFAMVIGLRTKRVCSTPLGSRSLAKRVRPVRRSGESAPR